MPEVGGKDTKAPEEIFEGEGCGCIDYLDCGYIHISKLINL